MYRFHNDLLDWFASYLSGRRQVAKINKTMSEQQSITQGVPQGLILGPLFFLLFVNDLPLQGSLEGLSLFADDATDSALGTNVKSVECQLQIKLDFIKGKIKAIYIKGLSDRDSPYKCLSLSFSDQHAF